MVSVLRCHDRVGSGANEHVPSYSSAQARPEHHGASFFAGSRCVQYVEHSLVEQTLSRNFLTGAGSLLYPSRI